MDHRLFESRKLIGTISGLGAGAPSSNPAGDGDFLNKKGIFIRVLGCLGSVVTFQRIHNVLCVLSSHG